MYPCKVERQARLDQVAGAEMSPIVPVQLHNFVQTPSQEDCSDSDKSEVLIPLVTTKCICSHETDVKPDNTQHEQDTDMPEESQSLLPQIPGITCTFTPSNDECLSTSSCSQTVLDFPMLSQNYLQEDRTKISMIRPMQRCSKNSKSQKSYLSPATQSLQSDFKEMRRRGDKMLEAANKRQGEYMGKSLNHPDFDGGCSQTQASSTDNLTFSQIPLSQTVAGETTRGLVHSQRETTLTQAMKISSKIEGLVTNLDKIPRKQMLVTEATLLHCISQLQDSLHSKLKRESYLQSNIDSYRQLLLTCQTGLSKVSQIHKTEKMTLTQSGYKDTTGLSQAQKTSVHLQRMKDLGKRQMRVLTLLKRQRCLVDLLKTLKRSGTSNNKPNKAVTRAEFTESSNNTKVTVKPGTSQAAESSCSSIHKPGSSRDSSQIHGQISDKNSQQALKSMKKSKVSENLDSSDNTTMREREPVGSADVSIDKADDTANRTGDDIQDTNCPMRYSQKPYYNTQDTTSGVDLFDDNDGDDVESTADTVNGNVNSDREYFSQASDNVKAGTAKKDVNDKIGAKVRLDLSKKSVLDRRNNQTVLDESVGSHGELKVSDKSKFPVTRCQTLEHDLTKEVDKSLTKKREELTSTTTERNAETVYKSQTKTPSFDGPNEDDEHEMTDTLSIKSMGVNDNDDDDSIEESNNVMTNQLKRKLDKESGNDVGDSKTKRLDIVDAGQDKTKPVSHSDVLWLNMLKVDADKTKSGKSGTQPRNHLQKKLEQSKVSIASNPPINQPNVGPENKVSEKSEKKVSEKSEKKILEKSTKESQMLTPRTAMNMNPQRNHPACDNGDRYGELNNSRSEHTVSKDTGINDVHDKSEECVIIDEVEVEDYHSPKVCSPLSMAVRGSPCETLNNVSPSCSTVCSEIFTLRNTQLDAQWRDHLNSTRGAQRFGINRNQNNNTQFNRSDNQTIQPPWMLSSQPDQFLEQVNMVKTIINNATGNDNVNMTKAKPLDTATKSVAVTDSIGDAIDSVIQKSRAMGTNRNSCNQKQSVLLSLKELVHLGILHPGKLVLSCMVKGVVHTASLTVYGKIRTTDGHTYNTVSSWLSTLSEGMTYKKRKAYDMTHYKGRSLLSYCRETNMSSHTRVTGPGNPVTDSSTQVDTAVFKVQRSTMTEDEKWLNKRLSTSVIRLLSDKDLVSNHDLPDNFWTEDFSKVRLNADLWNCVVAW